MPFPGTWPGLPRDFHRSAGQGSASAVSAAERRQTGACAEISQSREIPANRGVHMTRSTVAGRLTVERSKRIEGWLILRNGWPVRFETGQQYFRLRSDAEIVAYWLDKDQAEVGTEVVQ